MSITIPVDSLNWKIYEGWSASREGNFTSVLTNINYPEEIWHDISASKNYWLWLNIFPHTNIVARSLGTPLRFLQSWWGPGSLCSRIFRRRCSCAIFWVHHIGAFEKHVMQISINAIYSVGVVGLSKVESC